MPAKAETGLASWYGSESGKRTANGEKFLPHGLTAAHRRYAFGTQLKVTNLSNGLSVIVRVNDRGPFIKGRIIDLAQGAARVIKMGGVARVKIEVVK